jgi:predicted dehydrogenase
MTQSVPKVAVLGCGYWGKNLVRNFHELGALRAVVDPSAAGRDQAARIAPAVPVHADPSRVFEDAEIQAVVVATPAETHAVMCERALSAGKDVLCEKPLALSYADALHVVRLAEERGRILMVGHILEYHPAILKLRELVSSGQLGELRYLYSTRMNLGKLRREENVLWSFAPHDIAVILRLVGSTPLQVGAHGGAYLRPDVADVTLTHFTFAGGVAAHIFVSWLNPFKEQRLVVIGSRAMAVFDDVKRELVLHNQRVDMQGDGEPVIVKGEGERIGFSSDEPLRQECRAFLESVQTRVAPVTSGESGLAVLRVLNAAQESLTSHGRPIPISLDA